MRKLYTVVVFVFSATFLFAQNMSDVVRWSLHKPGGTARTFGVAGSFGAMGGDFGVMNINPAGLGEYAKGEFMFTPSINITDSESFLTADNQSKITTDKSTFKIDNIGLVISRNTAGSNWTHSNWAFGFNKISNLNRNFQFEGSTVGSITEEFAEYANGKSLDDLDNFRAYPAYNVGAIYDANGDNFYETDLQEFPNKTVNKTQIVDQEGYINELTFGWGGKYMNKLNLGLSMGIPFIRFEETKIYEEDDPGNEFAFFDDLTFTEYLNTSGVGVNFKAGFNYEFSKLFRLGAAIHSPTWYTLNDDYYTNLEYAFTDDGQKRFEHRSPDGSFEYEITSPWKVIGSIGSVHKIAPKIYGFINADIEWLDYSESSIDLTEHSSSPDDAKLSTEINNDINLFLGQSLNIRLGAELAYQKFRVRAGFESSQSPYNAEDDRNNAYAFGLGIRENKFFIDFGMRFDEYKEGYMPYTVLTEERNPLVNIESVTKRFLLTVGFKF